MDKSKEHWDLVLQVSKEWNNLPVEERKKYIVFSAETQLKVLCQVKTLCKDDMSPNCKKKITKWANNVADSLKQEFKEYLNKYGMSNEEKYELYEDNYYELQHLKKEVEKYHKLEEELGIELVEFFAVKSHDDIFMEISNDKKEMNFCGDAYYGTYDKEDVLKLIQELTDVYKEMLKNE